ncbi:hypothetical protein AVEN_239213-1 [Araneus ventricosus]|uniref:Uncharacterized protein n=1 Tax=Araneus ventricosus TaxID=182803 RepID=A0A4Y2UZD5_ARAVE|nr:hypothetical protein AVEN_239213-1 [Araneus ventricosus]
MERKTSQSSSEEPTRRYTITSDQGGDRKPQLHHRISQTKNYRQKTLFLLEIKNTENDLQPFLHQDQSGKVPKETKCHNLLHLFRLQSLCKELPFEAQMHKNPTKSIPPETKSSSRR